MLAHEVRRGGRGRGCTLSGAQGIDLGQDDNTEVSKNVMMPSWCSGKRVLAAEYQKGGQWAEGGCPTQQGLLPNGGQCTVHSSTPAGGQLVILHLLNHVGLGVGGPSQGMGPEVRKQGPAKGEPHAQPVRTHFTDWAPGLRTAAVVELAQRPSC